jgi:hypothetical protein
MEEALSLSVVEEVVPRPGLEVMALSVLELTTKFQLEAFQAALVAQAPEAAEAEVLAAQAGD